MTTSPRFRPKTNWPALAAPERSQITLLKRPNGGPAKARNTALEAIDPQQFSQIAFLDSDDRWENFHLANALALLNGEAEFYFADFYQLANDRTVFEKFAENGKLDLSRHRKAPWGSPNAIERIRDELRYLASTCGRFTLSASGEKIRRQKIDSLRKTFWRELRHRLLHGKRTAPGGRMGNLRRRPIGALAP